MNCSQFLILVAKPLVLRSVARVDVHSAPHVASRLALLLAPVGAVLLP